MRDIDDLLTQALQQDLPNAAFKARLKQESSRALIQAQQRRLWLRRSCMATAAVVMLSTAYLAGLNNGHQDQPSPLLLAQGTVEVPQDLVTWLDAARFFTQLGMEQRATNAYRQAGLLATPEQTESPYAQQSPSSVATLLARCDQLTEQTQKQPTETNHPYAILAQSLGGQRHDN